MHQKITLFLSKKPAQNFLKTVHNMCVNECINCAIFSTKTNQVLFSTFNKCITQCYPQISPLVLSRFIHTINRRILPVEHIFYPQSTPLIIKPIKL